MVSSYGQLFVAAALAYTITFLPVLGSEISHTLHEDEFPADVDNSFEYNPTIAHENVPESRLERLQQVLDEDTPPFSVAAGSDGSDQVPQRRSRRFWSASESSSEEEQQQPDTSGYAAAFDALLDYHAEVQRQGRRVVDMPDMHKETSERLLFFTVTTRMSVSGVRLRVPASLSRVSRITADILPSGDIDMSCNVRLADFETWGRYNVKVNGVGPSGNFETTISDRVVHATVRFRELPVAATTTSTTSVTSATSATSASSATSVTSASSVTSVTSASSATSATSVTSATSAWAGDALAKAEMPAPESRCSLKATELSLVERGRSDVPAVLSRWASQVEDVTTTLRVMKQLLNERLSHYPCGDGFVAMVRRGYAAATA